MLSTDSADLFLSERKSARTFSKRSNSIKHLISFYEATYSKKKDLGTIPIQTQDRINSETPKTNRFQRNISSPPTGRSNILNYNSDSKFLNISPPSSPGFSPSPSSSSSSSSERLSFYNNSYSVDSSHKKECCQAKDIHTPGMLW